MGLVDEVLTEFGGKVTIGDIKKMTYKELGYLREHHREMLKNNKDLAAGEALKNTFGA